MSIVIQPITLRVRKYCNGDIVLKFLNNYAGWDTVHFDGNAVRVFTQSIDEVEARRVKNFSVLHGAPGIEIVTKISAGESIQCTRQFPSYEKEGIQQMLSSRFVQIYYEDKWLDVQLSLKTWKDKIKDNAILVTIEIKLPERLINE